MHSVGIALGLIGVVVLVVAATSLIGTLFFPNVLVLGLVFELLKTWTAATGGGPGPTSADLYGMLLPTALACLVSAVFCGFLAVKELRER